MYRPPLKHLWLSEGFLIYSPMHPAYLGELHTCNVSRWPICVASLVFAFIADGLSDSCFTVIAKLGHVFKRREKCSCPPPSLFFYIANVEVFFRL